MKAELALVLAKAECFKVCGALERTVAADPYLAAKAHEPHRVALEAAYASFQGTMASHPASGTTQLDAHLVAQAV